MDNKKIELTNKLNELKEKLKNVKGTPCEVYSRIVGYFARTNNFNPGKLEEYKERINYMIDKKG